MNTIARTFCFTLFAAGLAGTSLGATNAGSGPVYPHHVRAIFGGSIKSDGKVAGTYGAEYLYQLHPMLGLGLFYEWSSGEYDAGGGGVPFSITLSEDLKLRLAAAVERELFQEDQFLFRIGVGYDLHAGQLTLAPSAWIDLVNGKQILFAGLTAGVRF
jgi:hypothetical protein